MLIRVMAALCLLAIIIEQVESVFLDGVFHLSADRNACGTGRRRQQSLSRHVGVRVTANRTFGKCLGPRWRLKSSSSNSSSYLRLHRTFAVAVFVWRR